VDISDQLQDAERLGGLSAKVLSGPTVEGYCNLFTFHSRQDPDYIAHLPPRRGRCDCWRAPSGMVSRVLEDGRAARQFSGHWLRVPLFSRWFLGTLAAYAFSRFRVPGGARTTCCSSSCRHASCLQLRCDSIYLMYRQLGLLDTAVGMILLYTAVNVSLAVWLLKGFIDEIARIRRGSAGRRLHRIQAFIRRTPTGAPASQLPLCSVSSSPE